MMIEGEADNFIEFEAVTEHYRKVRRSKQFGWSPSPNPRHELQLSSTARSISP